MKKNIEGRPEGTPNYMAPEVFSGVYNSKCDVYSFAIILWELFMQEHPFQQFKHPFQLIFAVSQQNIRPPIPEGCIPRLAQLMNICWTKDPKERPSFDIIIKKNR